MSYSINRVVVIGSGTMGGGIAAHVANAGIPVYLLDIAPRELTAEEEKRGLKLEDSQVRNRIVNASLERLKKSKPPAFFTPETAELITVGNLEDNFDWVSEATGSSKSSSSNYNRNASLWRASNRQKPGALFRVTPPDCRLRRLPQRLSSDFKSHFLGTHFFNPPRYMKLLEIIPTARRNRRSSNL